MTALATATEVWVAVCDLDAMTPERGVAALVEDRPVAVFRLAAGDPSDPTVDEVVAVDHVDPFHDVGVLARGLVASVGERDVVVSPLHKQRFDLRTGECLEDRTVAVQTWPVRVVDGVVHVGAIRDGAA